MTMFADDMAFYCHENFPTNMQSNLNADLAAIISWLHDNKLTLNVKVKAHDHRKLHQTESVERYIALLANNDRLEKVTKINFT